MIRLGHTVGSNDGVRSSGHVAGLAESGVDSWACVGKAGREKIEVCTS